MVCDLRDIKQHSCAENERLTGSLDGLPIRE
jgi:hypothetical protein